MTSVTGSPRTVEGADAEPIAGSILTALTTALERGMISKEDVLKALGVKRQSGRQAPPLPTFLFKSSGIEVKIRKMGPFTLDEIRLSMQRSPDNKPPSPPRVQVNYGTSTDPQIEWEDNPADPQYKKDLVDWQAAQTEKEGRQFIDTIVRHAVVVELGEDELEEVRHTRAFLIGMGIDKENIAALSDHEVYVKHVCVKNTDDLQRLQSEVIGQSIPTEALVKAHEDTFPSPVQEKASEGLAGAPLWNPI